MRIPKWLKNKGRNRFFLKGWDMVRELQLERETSPTGVDLVLDTDIKILNKKL